MDRIAPVSERWRIVRWPVQETLIALAEELGKPVSVRRSEPVLSRLRPTRQDDAKDRSLSSLYGTGAFPFHTDCAHHRIPPRFTLLRLAPGARSNRPTLVVPLEDLPLDSGELARLRNSVWLVNGGRGRFLSPLLTQFRGAAQIRFDEGCMRPAHNRFVHDGEILKDAIAKAQPARMDWEAGWVLIMDNWQVLHARGTTAEAGDEDRVLERVEVE
jgi:hypothetical protein